MKTFEVILLDAAGNDVYPPYRVSTVCEGLRPFYAPTFMTTKFSHLAAVLEGLTVRFRCINDVSASFKGGVPTTPIPSAAVGAAFAECNGTTRFKQLASLRRLGIKDGLMVLGLEVVA